MSHYGDHYIAEDEAKRLREEEERAELRESVRTLIKNRPHSLIEFLTEILVRTKCSREVINAVAKRTSTPLPLVDHGEPEGSERTTNQDKLDAWAKNLATTFPRVKRSNEEMREFIIKYAPPEGQDELLAMYPTDATSEPQPVVDEQSPQGPASARCVGRAAIERLSGKDSPSCDLCGSHHATMYRFILSRSLKPGKTETVVDKVLCVFCHGAVVDLGVKFHKDHEDYY